MEYVALVEEFWWSATYIAKARARGEQFFLRFVLDVDITTTNAWSLRREVLSTRPDDFLASLRLAVARVIDCGGGHDAELGMQPAGITG